MGLYRDLLGPGQILPGDDRYRIFQNGRQNISIKLTVADHEGERLPRFPFGP